MSDKIILVDCDGVLLNWADAFNEWAAERGFTQVRSDVYDMHLCYDISDMDAQNLMIEFNESAAICQLEPFRDSKYWVRRIYEELGYEFRVITSLSLCPYAARARELNLHIHFGEAIESVVCLETGAPKDGVLEEYAGSEYFWIEDKPENAVTGFNFGLRSILMRHDHNTNNVPLAGITIVDTWKQIYKIVKKG